ncbi:MAG TPA: hypothetical protein VJN94_14110 [Candidatus Binataceae bacterium]|nr:hypothetical protein [Candidatus Binataceae bacterium]
MYGQMVVANVNSKSNADAAAIQAATATESMRVNSRPYVEIGRLKEPLIAEWVPEQRNPKHGLAIWFQNAGNTPAQRVVLNATINSPDFHPEQFVHLSFKPMRPRMKGNAFELRAGEELFWNYTWQGPVTWIRGNLIAAHQDKEIPVQGLDPSAIKRALTKGTGQIVFIGSYEYTDIFNEYCCEAFIVVWNIKNGFSYGPSTAGPNFCASDLPNICKLKGEPSTLEPRAPK